MRFWLSVVWVVFAAPVIGAASADDIATGKKLNVTKCASCHELYKPARYSVPDWESWMAKMKRKARLDDEQYRQLNAYFNSVRGE